MKRRLRSSRTGTPSSQGPERDSLCKSIGGRLILIRGTRSQREFATSIGCHPNTIGQYERGERAPVLSIVNRLCEVYQIDHRWPLTGLGSRMGITGDDPSGSMGSTPIPDERLGCPLPGDSGRMPPTLLQEAPHLSKHGNAWVPVPFLGAPPPPGKDRYERDVREHQEEQWYLPCSFLGKELGASPQRPFLFKMQGDAMDPTIRDGETMLLEGVVPADDRHGIFLVQIDRQVAVRRLQALPGGLIQVAADNARYPSFSVPDGSRKAADGFLILARILRTLHRP